MSFEFLLPFILPLGLFILAATIDSIFVYGQVLSADKVVLPFKGFRLLLTHYAKFAHQFYFGCFGYDLSALVGLASKTKDCNIIASYPPLIVSISCGIIFHILAYLHSYYVHIQYERKNFAHPMTWLNAFYTVLSVFLIWTIRWFEARI